MKKRTLSFLLALMMCLTLLPMTALAAGAVNKAAPVISDLTVYYSDENSEAGVEFTMTLTDENKALLAQYEEIGYGLTLEGEISIDGGEWQSLSVEAAEMYYPDEYLEKDGQRVRSLTSPYISAEKSIKYRVNFFAHYPDVGDWTGEYSNVLTLNEKIDFEASEWAQEELARADELGLIPDCLEGADLTKPITRAEFAAVGVKVYEALAQTAAVPAAENPFTDTTDAEVLKAYNVGITDGVAADKFEMVYSLLIDEIQKACPQVKIMLMEPFVLPGTATSENIDYFQSEVALRAQAVRRVAEKFNIGFLPLQELFDEACEKAPADYWLSDGVHPTAFGHELIARAWCEKYKQMNQ